MRAKHNAIKKIEAFCGKKILLTSLKRLSSHLTYKESILVDNLIIYISCIYRIETSLENDMLLYHSTFKKINTLLFKKSKELNCETLLFTANLIQENLQSVEGVKKIA